MAITDLETTGTDPRNHEIIELGLLVVDQKSLAILDSLELKVRPEHLVTASESALRLNGYNEHDWAGAVSLSEVMTEYSRKVEGAMFCSHNVTFDWSFIQEAVRTTGVPVNLDYHRLDIFTMGWTVLRGHGLDDFNLSKVAKYLGLGEEPVPHRAINGARMAYEVFKRLTTMR
jgi:DNA polymerase-3 subunit epsilon